MAKQQTLPAGLTEDDLAQALALLQAERAKETVAQVRTEIAGELTESVARILEVQPVKPSSKESSTWVGTVYGGMKVQVDGRTYSVQVSIKDDGASAVRKAGG